LRNTCIIYPYGGGRIPQMNYLLQLSFRTSENSVKAKVDKYGFAPVLWDRNPTNVQLSEAYYEEVRIKPQGSRSESTTLTSAGQGPCGLPRLAERRSRRGPFATGRVNRGGRRVGRDSVGAARGGVAALGFSALFTGVRGRVILRSTCSPGPTPMRVPGSGLLPQSTIPTSS
jgi:hypothetical protein